MRSPTGRFERSARLLRSHEFRRVSARGSRTVSDAFVLIGTHARSGERRVDGTRTGARLGITASRKVGNAVERNHVKRRVREWFRQDRASLPAHSDWVVIARRPAVALDGKAIAAELERLSARLARRWNTSGAEHR